MRLGSLFSGCGGLDLAVEEVFGARTAWVAEVEKAPSQVLAVRFPDAPNLGDVTAVDWTAVPPVDVIAGGSPCQDLSHAGARAGMKDGTRSGLWSAMCAAIEQLRPQFVVWENVQGALSAAATPGEMESCDFCMDDSGSGAPLRALGRVLGDLAEVGYDAAWHCLRAADVGAPHNRLRVFVLAWDATAGHPGYESRSAEQRLEPQESASRLGESDSVLASDRYRVGDDGRGPSGPRGGANLQTAIDTLATDSNCTVGGQRRVAAPGQTPGGRPRSDVSGRGRTPDLNYLPTPTARDGKGKSLPSRAGGDALPDVLLPTPLCEPTTGNGHARNLGAEVRLMPTPAVNDMGDGKTLEWWDEWAPRQQSADGRPAPHGKSLAIEAQRLLPTATAQDAAGSGSAGYGGNEFCTLTDATVRQPERFGQYTAAITRWEQVLGRPAPAPTSPTGRNGAERLNPAFVEWMVGLRAGWVTDVPDISRNNQLRMFGNVVVPQQATAALQHLLTIRNTEVTA